MKRSFALCLTFCLFSLGVTAQESTKPQEAQPSLDETTHWLKEKIANYGSYNAIVNWTETVNNKPVTIQVNAIYMAVNPEIDGCAFTYSYLSNMPPPITRQWDNVIQLGDIDPSKITLEDNGKPPYLVKLHTFNDEAKIRQDQKLGRASFGIKNVSEAIVPFSDKDIAERAVKAFVHTATLCKKKKEPF